MYAVNVLALLSFKIRKPVRYAKYTNQPKLFISSSDTGIFFDDLKVYLFEQW